MEMWEKDPFDDFIQTFLVQLSPSKELPDSVQSFQILRDDKLNIIMHVRSDADARPKLESKPLGLVYILDNRIELKGYVGSGALLHVSMFNTTLKILDENQESFTTSKYKIGELNYTITDDPIDYTVDHIANLPTNYIWPESTNTKESGTQEICFLGNPPITVSRPLPSKDNFSRNSVRFDLGGYTVVIGTTQKKNSGLNPKSPGFIYYSGNPDKVTRAKIRACLSFSLGLPLIHLSSRFYTQAGGLVGFEVTSPETMGGRAWSLVSQPFSPITSNPTNILDARLLQKLANPFFENYDSMNLKSFIFRLWHADVSPTHMKAAYYGAMIESIQKSETSKPDSRISHTIIEKSEYRKTIRVLSRFLQKQKISLDAKDLLLKKIQNGNTAPQRILADRFYSSLGLFLGPLETAAWDRRNDAAHGNVETPGAEIENFRSTKILRIVLARVVLKLLDGSEEYIDYYTLTHPTRGLGEAIPDTTE